jgi:hypothetical protein
MSDVATEQDISGVLYEVSDRGAYASLSCSFEVHYTFDEKRRAPNESTFSESIEEALEKVVQNRGKDFPTYISNSNGSKAAQEFDKRRRYVEKANFGVYLWRHESATGNPLMHIDESMRELITDANVRLISFNYKGHQSLGRVIMTADVTRNVLESEGMTAEARQYMMALCREVQEALGVAHLFQAEVQ